ncbi:hypothetical protein ACE7GA_24320 [Roseomonas sp. CCTCC AB2023176]|uniref:hypothetical protein n=1 Tax=Roseomonas sp. CCTCC AB2023176 TaxID=3342640 RepID=UPI0035E30D8B
MSEQTTRKMVRIPTWCTISDMSRSATYREIAKGNLKAVRMNGTTFVDAEAGITWMRSLPAAPIRQRQAA